MPLGGPLKDRIRRAIDTANSITVPADPATLPAASSSDSSSQAVPGSRGSLRRRIERASAPSEAEEDDFALIRSLKKQSRLLK